MWKNRIDEACFWSGRIAPKAMREWSLRLRSGQAKNDGDVQVLVACAAGLLGAVAVDAVAGLDDPRQTLDIEVDQVARDACVRSAPRAAADRENATGSCHCGAGCGSPWRGSGAVRMRSATHSSAAGEELKPFLSGGVRSIDSSAAAANCGRLGVKFQ